MDDCTHQEYVALRERVARLEERFIAMQLALVQARDEMDRRMEELNDVRTRFLPREVFDREHSATIGRVAVLEQSKAGVLGTIAAYGSVITFLLAASGLIIYFVSK